MINNMGLWHYLSEDTYKEICKALDLSLDNNVNKNFPNDHIFNINLFNIEYNQIGHIWFMNIYLNLPKFQCNLKMFEKKLYEQYKKLFGKKVMENFPKMDQLICGYIEYINDFMVDNAIELEQNARNLGYSPVQLELDINNLKHKDKSHSKMHLCISKTDEEHVQTLIFGFGTVLKNRIKDKMYHKTVGIKIPKILEIQTEIDIVNWTLKKNKFELKIKE